MKPLTFPAAARATARTAWLLAALAGAAASTAGCSVAGAAAGAAVSVAGTVVVTGVSLTGKAIGAGIDAMSSRPQDDGSGIVIHERIRPAEGAGGANGVDDSKGAKGAAPATLPRCAVASGEVPAPAAAPGTAAACR